MKMAGIQGEKGDSLGRFETQCKFKISRKNLQNHV